ncbi:MAG: GFA family protein [Steroidobacteraceae bacterium]
MPNGQCHCAAIRYEVVGTPIYSGLCHCSDCRRHAGAPLVGWTAYPASSLTVLQGAPKIYASSEHGRRHFCADCGTGLFYFNDVALPGIADIQTATLDDPGAIAPQMHVQVAERIAWMEGAHALPVFERYPSRD